MEIKASLKHLRMSAQKVRLVADLVRKMKTDKAIAQLKFANKHAAEPLIKLIQSAIANAVSNFEADPNNLLIKEIMVNEGATLKRWTPKAHGRATPIRKRSCHIELTLGEIVDGGIRQAKKSSIDAPVKLEDLAKAAEKSAQSAAKKKASSKATKAEASEEKEGEREVRGVRTKTEGSAGKGFAKSIFRRKAG
jgi:large subunit ribosomal protein L22